MLRNQFSIFFGFLLMGCGGKFSDPIYIPEPDDSYFESSIEVLEDELQDQPQNLELIELQLSYLNYLGWTPEAGDAIERARKFVSVSSEIRNYLKTYYQASSNDEELLLYYNDLERLGVITKEERLDRIDVLIRMGSYPEALTAVESLRGDVEISKLNLQLGILYYQTGNTPLSMRYFHRAYQENSTNPALARIFVPELIKYGYYNYAKIVLEDYPQLFNDRRIKELNAEVLYQLGNRDSAENIMKSIGDEDAFLTLAGWYKSSMRYDSAVFYLSRVLSADTTNLAVIIQLADINNSRNYLSNARDLYQKALEFDSANNYVQNQLNIVNRKIAYLRRIREQEEEIPVLNLDKKKVEN